MGRYVNRIILSLRRQRSYNNKRYENRKNSSTTTKTTQRPRKHTETQQYNTGSDWVKTTPPSNINISQFFKILRLNSTFTQRQHLYYVQGRSATYADYEHGN